MMKREKTGARTGVWLLCLAACSPHSSTNSGPLDGDSRSRGDSEVGTVPDASSSDGAASVARVGTDAGTQGARGFDVRALCDGSTGLRLGFEGGRDECTPSLSCPGAHILGELGATYLYLDGKCNLYMSLSFNAGTRLKRLTTPELDAFAAELRVAEWPPPGSYCDNIERFDATGNGVRYYRTGDIISVMPCVDAKPTAIAGQAHRYLVKHYAEGEPLRGAIRYTLVPTKVPDQAAFNYVKDLPALEQKVVLPEHADSFGGMLTPVFLAEGVDADKLRVLRDAWVGVGGPQFSNLIPVQDRAAGDGVAGTKLELRIRDVLPLEQPPGQQALF